MSDHSTEQALDGVRSATKVLRAQERDERRADLERLLAADERMVARLSNTIR